MQTPTLLALLYFLIFPSKECVPLLWVIVDLNHSYICTQIRNSVPTKEHPFFFIVVINLDEHHSSPRSPGCHMDQPNQPMSSPLPA
ncbi:hypothetical protein F4804DRAFT_292125 [Jackrogersella minutella]|nr:hypothetical protein F4804DRAFT_292125 [Jackrogersella minutella]